MVRSTEAAKQMPLTTVTVSRRRLAVLCLDRAYREKIDIAPGPIPNAPHSHSRGSSVLAIITPRTRKATRARIPTPMTA